MRSTLFSVLNRFRETGQFHCWMIRLVAWVFFLQEGVKPYPVLGANASVAPVQHRVQTFLLEDFELKGSTRISKELLGQELGLVPGLRLDDAFVTNARSKVLGLGLFKSVILVMKKGHRPGRARLIIEVDDDTNVLSDWAMGGILGVMVADTKAASGVTPSSNVPMNFKLGLVSRNLFSELHRGSGLVDVDDSGFIRQARLAYGLPRFADESTQFDAEVAVVDPRYRYLESRGFGARTQGLWTQSIASAVNMEWFYGMAMYLNHHDRFKVPGFPKLVAGPKMGFYRETRLRGFFPQEGAFFSTSLVVSPLEFHRSVFELEMAHTLEVRSWLLMTFDLHVTTIGIEGYSGRGDLRFDLPFVSSDPSQDQAAAYVSLQAGHDRFEKTSLMGSSALVGMRYHSSGFIADIGIKITHSPEELTPDSPIKSVKGVHP